MGQRAPAAAIFALLAFALVFQGSRGLWDPDEGRYVHTAARMVETGDWWTPRLHPDVPHFTKPPLTYWTIAASISLFGRNEWAIRLPNALAWCGTVVLVFFLARRLAPKREWLAASIQATALLPFAALNIVTTDTLLAFCETVAVAGFVRARWDPDGARDGPLWMWVGFGLAFLTKGPPGLLPLAAILAFALSTEGLRGLARLKSLAGMALFLLLAFSWYLAQVVARPDLLGYLLGQEVVGRVASTSFNRNADLAGIFRVYGPVVLAGCLPWAPWAVARWVRRRRRGEVAGPTALETRLLRWWLLLPLAVFVLSKSRLQLYLVPLATPAVLLIARSLPEDALVPARRRRWLALWIALLIALKGFAASYPTSRDGRRLAAELSRLLPYSPRELVVVQRKPPYTLGFYLRAETEAVDLAAAKAAAPSSPYLETRKTLAVKLDENRPESSYLVPKAHEPAFVDRLRALGWTAARIGSVGDLQVYAAPRPLPPAAAD